MKSRIIIGAKVATLLGTGWLLIATSPMPPECTAEGPLAYDVTGTCGPSGELQLTKDPTCNLIVTGGETVNLPNGGEGFWSDQSISGGNFRLDTFGAPLAVPGGAQADAGTGHDAGEESDAGVEEDGGTTSDGGADVADAGTSYLPGSQFSSCLVAPADPDGTLDFECHDDETTQVACTGTLTPKP